MSSHAWGAGGAVVPKRVTGRGGTEEISDGSQGAPVGSILPGTQDEGPPPDRGPNIEDSR